MSAEKPNPFMPSHVQEFQQRIYELETAIRKHRDLQLHQRCWLDDQELYAALKEPLPEGCGKLPAMAEFLHECINFRATRNSADFAKCAVQPFGIYPRFRVGQSVRQIKDRAVRLQIISMVIEQDEAEGKTSIRYRVKKSFDTGGTVWLYMPEEELEAE